MGQGFREREEPLANDFDGKLAYEFVPAAGRRPQQVAAFGMRRLIEKLQFGFSHNRESLRDLTSATLARGDRARLEQVALIER